PPDTTSSTSASEGISSSGVSHSIFLCPLRITAAMAASGSRTSIGVGRTSGFWYDDSTILRSSRLVQCASMRIVQANFPNLPKQNLQETVAEITRSIPDNDRVIALDRVLAFVDKSTIKPKDVH